MLRLLLPDSAASLSPQQCSVERARGAEAKGRTWAQRESRDWAEQERQGDGELWLVDDSRDAVEEEEMEVDRTGDERADDEPPLDSSAQLLSWLGEQSRRPSRRPPAPAAAAAGRVSASR